MSDHGDAIKVIFADLQRLELSAQSYNSRAENHQEYANDELAKAESFRGRAKSELDKAAALATAIADLGGDVAALRADAAEKTKKWLDEIAERDAKAARTNSLSTEWKGPDLKAMPAE